ncbi:MAG: hypothetical protein ACI8W8_001706 [Rhodothermales bacterium]|jgi:hypothetical protein
MTSDERLDGLLALNQPQGLLDAWSVFFSLYELVFLCAHHKRQPTQVDAWEGSKHRILAEHINAEDPSYDIIVGEISMNGPMA